MSKSTLLYALTVIKSECVKHKYCEHCPFSNEESECLITHSTPNQWYLIDDEPCDEKLIF